MHLKTNLLLEDVQWLLHLIPVAALRCFPLGQNRINLHLHVAVLLLQLPHPAQVIGQTVVQTPQSLLVVRGDNRHGRSEGGCRGSCRGRSRVSLRVVAQHIAQPLQTRHGHPGAPSPGSTEHTG